MTRIGDKLANVLLICLLILCLVAVLQAQPFGPDKIPLPEHPRPNFQRPLWQNLNGPWHFRFDPDDKGK